MKSKVVVELLGVNGERFNLTTGDRGVYLATDPKGAFFDPPVKAVYEEPGNYPGSRYLSHRVLRREITFGVEILNDGGSNSWLSRDSQWRKAWAFDKDSILSVTTPESGTRYLKLRLLESPEVDMKYDPTIMAVNTTLMQCVAPDPFWYEDDVVYSAVTQTDTRFDPNALQLPWPWPKNVLPSEDLYVTVDPSDGRGGLNPTDQYIFPKWTVPGSTEAPAEPYIPGLPWLGAPKSRATIWTLPDYSFEDPDYADRRVRLPGLIGGLRTDEVQAFNLDGRISGGTFRIKLGDEYTPALSWGATVGQVKGALEATAQVAYDDCVVTRGKVTNEVQTIELKGGATGGQFRLSFDGVPTPPMPWNVLPLELGGSLNATSTIGLFNVEIAGKAVTEVQEIQLTGEPTGGTFKIGWEGNWTDDIPWNAASLIVANKMAAALPGLGVFNVTVYKNSWKKYSPWIIKFKGDFVGVNPNLLEVDGSNLTGGAGADVVVKTQTQGGQKWKVQFRSGLTGYNVPQIQLYENNLTGGVDPTVEITTEVQGSHPYILSFRNGLSGVNLPLVEIDTTNLTANAPTMIQNEDGSWTAEGGKSFRAWKVVEGYTAPAENCVVDSDPRNEQIISESGSTVWGRMNGVRFRHPIPPYTASKTFKVSVSGCAPGQMVTLRLPRPWSRPWGLE